MGSSVDDADARDAAALEVAHGRAGSLAYGCHWRHRRHLHSERRWESRATWLSLVGGLFAFLAGLTLLTDAAKDERSIAIVVGALGVIAGLIPVIDKALGPVARAEKHKRAADAFENMRGRYRHFIDTWTDGAGAADRLATLEREHADAKSGSIEPEPWTQSVIEHERANHERRS